MKKCFKCGEEKSLDEFYIHHQMKDGHLNKCKECSKSDIKNNILNNKEYYKEYDRQRAMLPHRIEARKKYQELHPEKIRRYKKNYEINNPEKRLESTRKYRNLNPEKYKAQSLVNSKKKSNKLIKQPCAVCGELKVHAHHSDYSKPLEVVWLCPKHHKEVHKK